MISAMCVFAEGEKIARHFNPYNNRALCGYYIMVDGKIDDLRQNYCAAKAFLI
jgi:hypothetical protein